MKRTIYAITKKSTTHSLKTGQHNLTHHISSEATQASLEQAAKIARILLNMAKELSGPILSAWVKGARLRSTIRELRKLTVQQPETDPRVILDILEQFYSQLYNVRATFPELSVDRLPITNFSKMEAPISQKEIDIVLSKCKRHSSPGPDRILYEFYKTFPKLLPLLNRVFNHCYFKEVVPHS